MSNSAEQSFRSNLSQFRWAQSNNAEPQQDASGPPSGRFARFYNAIGGGYIPLRSNERSNDEEAYFALSRWERYERPETVCDVTDGCYVHAMLRALYVATPGTIASSGYWASEAA